MTNSAVQSELLAKRKRSRRVPEGISNDKVGIAPAIPRKICARWAFLVQADYFRVVRDPPVGATLPTPAKRKKHNRERTHMAQRCGLRGQAACLIKLTLFR